MTVENAVTPGSEPVEVLEKKARRRFTIAEKRRILAAIDACQRTSDVNALMRQEGIYHSYLSNWRRQLYANGSVPAKRGPKPASLAESSAKAQVVDLERKLAKMTARAERAEALVELQKKVAALLAAPASDEQP